MSSIPQNAENGNEISNSVINFMTQFQIGKLLFKCNAGKAKGIPVIEVFRYLFCLIFSDRSMYMQWKTGIFDGSFCKNTVYRFLNNAKINWARFTTLLSMIKFAYIHLQCHYPYIIRLYCKIALIDLDIS